MAVNTRVIRVRREHAEILDTVCLENGCSQTRAFEMILKGEIQPLGQQAQQSGVELQTFAPEPLPIPVFRY